MLYIILIFIIVFLVYQIYIKEKNIKRIYQQLNDILYQQKNYYTQYYKEGSLSLLENEIAKMVNLLNDQNHLLKQDKILLKQSLEDISHQMKTPLTSLNIIQERLKKAEEKEKRQLIKEQQLLFNKIEWLVTALLKIAQLDANTVTFQKEDISSYDFYHRLIKPFEIQLDLKNITVQENYQDFLMTIDILWTLEALSNILQNCIEHTYHNGHIMISINHNPLYDEIIIEDDGESIDQEDLPHLFERFYKGKNSSESSVGIGLALSQMIIEKQNGTITLENINPGVKFTIHFYKEIV